MIRITRYNSKWRLRISEELLEFEDEKDFEKVLSEILKIKAKYEPKVRPHEDQGSKYLE